MLCIFVCMIAHTVLLQSCIFGGKDETGEGAPEGLPLICRFSNLTLALSYQERGRKL
jgi:hypothetical protein